MVILNKMNIITRVILCFFLVSIISCKGEAQSSNQITLDNLPVELADKTWIPYYKGNTYEDLLRRVEYPVTRYVKTSKTSFSKLEGKMEFELVELPNKKIVKEGNKYIMLLEAPYLDYISLSWIDKQKGLIDIEYVYKKPLPIDVKDSIFTISYVDKSYITPDNFPELKKEEIVLEKDEAINSNIYSELIDDLPVEGMFSCKYAEEGEMYSGAYLKISNKDYEVENVSDNTTEIFRNDIKIKIEDVLYLQCDARKIKSSSNKYALFYKTFYTKYDPPEQSQYYSKSHPIAEIEILDNNTIKKRWLGVYNKRTKKTESIDGYFDWDDEYCDTIKRQN